MTDTTVDVANSENADNNETADHAADVRGGDSSGSDSASGDGADSLGDPGKKALAAMKEREKAARAKARELEREIAELRAAAESANKTPDEQAIDAARREAEAEATARANERILRYGVRAAATGRLANPEDALSFLDISQFDVDSDGNVSDDEISDAITELLEKKPYLAAQGGRVSLDSGSGKSPGPRQLTRDDLSRMSADEIAEAEAAGRFNHLLGRS